MVFPRLRELDLWQSICSELVVPLFLEFMSKCPNLTSCEWGNYPLDDELFFPRFLELLNSWPNLHRLCIRTREISQDDLSRILTGMQRIASLDICCSPDSLKADIMKLLRPRFSDITVVRLGAPCRREMCPMAQEIISSCPLLESFHAALIEGTLVAEGKPWVCLGLKNLSLWIALDPSTIHQSSLECSIKCQDSGTSERCIGGPS